MQALKARQLEIKKDKAAAEQDKPKQDCQPAWARLGQGREPEKRLGDDMPYVPVEEKIRWLNCGAAFEV